MVRVWRFLSSWTKPAKPQSEIPAASTTLPTRQRADVLAGVEQARIRFAARHAQEAANAAALTSAQKVLVSQMKGENSALWIMRLVPQIGGVYHVRAVDLALAERDKRKDVPLCNDKGELLADTDPTRRQRLPLAIILSGQIEPAFIPERTQDSTVVQHHTSLWLEVDTSQVEMQKLEEDQNAPEL